MKSLATIGRIIFALPFLGFAFFHFSNAEGMAGMVPNYVPGGVIWVYITGAGLLAGGILILMGKYVKLGAAIIAILMLTFAVTVQLQSVLNGNQMAMGQLLKDTALCGAALYILATGK